MQVQSGKSGNLAKATTGAAIGLARGAGMLLLAFSMPIHAAEFGEASVTSWVGQPLVAEVELTALSPDEQAALQVRPALLDVYRGANIQYNPALKTLRWAVVNRGGRLLVRLTTEKPINASYLNLFLELGTKSERAVRALTIWLDADPDNAGNGAQLAVIADDASHPAHIEADGVVGREPGRIPGVAGSNVHATASMPLPTATVGERCTGEARCIAAERQNQVIAKNISELEKKVGALRKVMLGAAPLPVSGAKVPASEATGRIAAPAEEHIDTSAEVPPVEAAASAAASDGPLFLDSAPPPVIPKKPVVAATPWKMIAMIGAALAALALAALLWLKKAKASKKPMMSSKVKPVPKPAGKALNWWAKSQEKWRDWYKGRKAGKDKPAQEPAADVAESAAPVEDGKESKSAAMRRALAERVDRLKQKLAGVGAALGAKFKARAGKKPTGGQTASEPVSDSPG